jgi:hypothetical protein
MLGPTAQNKKEESMIENVAFGGYAESIIKNPADYDALEVHGVTSETDRDGTIHCEVDDENPEFYSVYAHRAQGGVECIGDFATQQDANKYADETASRYNWPVIAA